MSLRQGCYGDGIRTVYHDLFLRKIFCASCRRARIVNVDKLADEEPKLYARLHPFATVCVKRTPRALILAEPTLTMPLSCWFRQTRALALGVTWATERSTVSVLFARA